MNFETIKTDFRTRKKHRSGVFQNRVHVSVYLYGFQGQERDDEIKGKGNSLNYTYRMHDPRLGRFFAVDPLTSKYPWYSPYQFSGNKVIAFNELEGLEEVYYSHKLNAGGYAFRELFNESKSGIDAINQITNTNPASGPVNLGWDVLITGAKMDGGNLDGGTHGYYIGYTRAVLKQVNDLNLYDKYTDLDRDIVTKILNDPNKKGLAIVTLDIDEIDVSTKDAMSGSWMSAAKVAFALHHELIAHAKDDMLGTKTASSDSSIPLGHEQHNKYYSTTENTWGNTAYSPIFQVLEGVYKLSTGGKAWSDMKNTAYDKTSRHDTYIYLPRKEITSVPNE